MQVKETLTQARALITDQNHWTQGALARDKDNLIVDALKSTAVCWCMYGAMIKVSQGKADCDKAIVLLRKKLEEMDYEIPLVSRFNDYTDHAQVLKFLDDTIASL